MLKITIEKGTKNMAEYWTTSQGKEWLLQLVVPNLLGGLIYYVGILIVYDVFLAQKISFAYELYHGSPR